MSEEQSLQDRYAPGMGCFGCGPANAKGLRIKSVVDGDECVLDWTAQPHHQAFEGMLNGGIVGALFDCHCVWTAAHHLMRKRGGDTPPCTVTAEFTVKFRRPTPVDRPLEVRAHVVESSDNSATVEAVMRSGGEETATCRGVFVAVKPDHPAYHRW